VGIIFDFLELFLMALRADRIEFQGEVAVIHLRPQGMRVLVVPDVACRAGETFLSVDGTVVGFFIYVDADRFTRRKIQREVMGVTLEAFVVTGCVLSPCGLC